MSATIWKLIALISLAVSALLGLGVLYAALAYGSNLREIARGQGVCLAGQRAYDSIAAAQMIGRLDLVSFLLTIGGILLAIFAFMGFWMIRREVLDQASQVAADEARKVAQTYYNLDMNEPGTYISRQQASQKIGKSATINKRARTTKRDAQSPSFDPAAISVAGATEETPGATNAGPKAGPGSDPGASKRDSRTDGSNS